ncbi:MAG: hypothetical protein ISN28_15550 [Ectothiorhodospiraceae bacterium AqS1]|nr:hypothetical protein [Ectothiorhodospiraceae bacterium AqS1]MBF2761647.1 hypothetical protein [Ectothiorhodospiraceae bacterium AqS1]
MNRSAQTLPWGERTKDGDEPIPSQRISSLKVRPADLQPVVVADGQGLCPRLRRWLRSVLYLFVSELDEHGEFTHLGLQLLDLQVPAIALTVFQSP